VTHALLLLFIRARHRSAGYTYSELEEGFIDRMTAATRRQLQKPNFNPTRATQLRKMLEQD
jgi:hypothetical protein